MNLIPFQAVYPNFDLISSPESFFGTVKHQYPEYVKSGFFQKAAQESIYIYKIQSSLGEYIGIIACANINDFIKGRVLKHENTLAAKEQQMMHIVLQNRAMVKPILLAYNRNEELTKIIATHIKKDKPFFDIEFPETVEYHTIWSVNDGEDIEAIKLIFKEKIKKTYIADGHHRSSTAINLYQHKNHAYPQEAMEGVLTVLFPFDQLQIYDYNRVVEIFRDLTPVDFIVKMSQFFSIKPIKSPRKPRQKHDMTLLLEKKWYRLRWKPKILKAHNDKNVLLDTDLFNKYVLGNICGIVDVREDRRIMYVDGVSGIVGLTTEVNKNENRFGLCLFPISTEELKSIAKNGDTLPPKSTWFEPRVKNGMIVKEF